MGEQGPPRRSVLALAAVLMLPLLAGCLGAAPDADPAGEGTDGDPTDGSERDGASTGDEGSGRTGRPVHEEATTWVRDAWGDADRIVLFEGTVQTGGVVTAPGTCIFCVGGNVPVPEGRVVLPGTDRIEVTVDWQAPPTAPSVFVFVEWMPPGGEWQRESLDEPGNVTIPLDANATDVPFAAATDWMFDADAYADPAGSNYQMEVDVTIAIHRSVELPDILVPPDPWGDGDRIVLVDNRTYDNALHLDGESAFLGNGVICIQGTCGSAWRPQDGALVPANASRVRAVLTWDWAAPSLPVLEVRVGEADAVPTELVEDGEGRRVFESEVTPDRGDSLFQRVSGWLFEARLETGGQGGGAASGSMTLAAWALR